MRGKASGAVHTVYLAFGSNLGDRARLLSEARDRLDRLPGTYVVAMSSLHETEPVGGPPGQGLYLNAAVKIETRFAPHDLLAECLTIERALGRVRTAANAPRTIDIDILLYDDLVLDTPELVIPHPRMHERSFVLRPLADIANSVMHPGLGLLIQRLLEAAASADCGMPESYPSRTTTISADSTSPTFQRRR